MNTHTGSSQKWLRLRLLIALVASFGPVPAAAQSVVEYYSTDAVGSVRTVFDNLGNVLARSDYLPFGEAYTTSGALPSARFTGQERDSEAGLDNFNARAFDSGTGRFTRLDPAGGDPRFPQTWNRYAYGRNDPLGFNDPSGMVEKPANLPTWWTSDMVAGGGAYYGTQYATHSPGAPGTSGALERQLSGQGFYTGGEVSAAMAAHGSRVDSAFVVNWAENYAADHPDKLRGGAVSNRSGGDVWTKPEECAPGACLERVANNRTRGADGFTIEGEGKIYKVPDLVEVVVLPGGGTYVGTYGAGMNWDIMQQSPGDGMSPADDVGRFIHSVKGGGWYTPAQWMAREGPRAMEDVYWGQLWDKAGVPRGR